MKTMILSAVAGGLALCCSFALGEDLKVSGKRYENVKWGSATPAEVTFFHKEGVAKLRLSDLPPEIQQKFNYDPTKAQEYEEAQAKKKRDEESARFYGTDATQPGETPVDDVPVPSFNAEIDSNRFYLVRELNGMMYGPFECAVGSRIDIEGNIYKIIKVNDLLFTLQNEETQNAVGPFWLKDYANLTLETLVLKIMRPTAVAAMLEKRRNERTMVMENQYEIVATQDVPVIEGPASLEGKKADRGLTVDTNRMSNTSLKKGRSSFK